MEELKGEHIKVLPFKEIKKVADLIYFDGPILSHFKDKFGKDILFYWVDVDENVNRWLVFQISEKQLYQYISKQLTLKSLVNFPYNDILYTVEIGGEVEYRNIIQIFKDDLNDIYIPESSSFFESEIP